MHKKLYEEEGLQLFVVPPRYMFLKTFSGYYEDQNGTNLGQVIYLKYDNFGNAQMYDINPSSQGILHYPEHKIYGKPDEQTKRILVYEPKK